MTMISKLAVLETEDIGSNVEIAEFSVVRAGAVVIKDVQPYDLVMGVPARVVRNLKAGL